MEGSPWYRGVAGRGFEGVFCGWGAGGECVGTTDAAAAAGDACSGCLGGATCVADAAGGQDSQSPIPGPVAAASATVATPVDSLLGNSELKCVRACVHHHHGDGGIHEIIHCVVLVVVVVCPCVLWAMVREGRACPTQSAAPAARGIACTHPAGLRTSPANNLLTRSLPPPLPPPEGVMVLAAEHIPRHATPHRIQRPGQEPGPVFCVFGPADAGRQHAVPPC